ncbi:serine hydroxymethyltransferase, mitochondrial [Artemisia annua]|uniref:Serine hydroxymethyltransferase, mitochondrial n=1 Tax=Artemisia annua TaxID=35608 RepID=A0A2U1KDM8_ARTAN|nr:serine hydroxymethyltransferase, mitochondrial [Artemisia annua]
MESENIWMNNIPNLKPQNTHTNDPADSKWPKQLNAPLEVVDPKIADIIEHEKARQWKVMSRMIVVASELCGKDKKCDREYTIENLHDYSLSIRAKLIRVIFGIILVMNLLWLPHGLHSPTARVTFIPIWSPSSPPIIQLTVPVIVPPLP